MYLNFSKKNLKEKHNNSEKITRNHNLPIETGRWKNISSKERKCTNCNVLGKIYHYFMVCPLFNYDRKQYTEKMFIEGLK